MEVWIGFVFGCSIGGVGIGSMGLIGVLRRLTAGSAQTGTTGSAICGDGERGMGRGTGVFLVSSGSIIDGGSSTTAANDGGGSIAAAGVGGRFFRAQ